MLRHRSGELDCDIPVVISNHADLAPLVKQFGVEFCHIPITKENKRVQEQKQIDVLVDKHVDLVVLARYMQILSSVFVECFSERIINIHHSFLPAFV